MGDIPEIDPTGARARADTGALLLDVRTEDEWEAGRIEDATWISMSEIEARREEIPTDREIIVVCRSGGRSARVTEVLRAWGHDAHNLAGGVLAWTAEDLPFVGEVA